MFCDLVARRLLNRAISIFEADTQGAYLRKHCFLIQVGIPSILNPLYDTGCPKGLLEVTHWAQKDSWKPKRTFGSHPLGLLRRTGEQSVGGWRR